MDVNENRLLRTRSTFRKSVTVLVGILMLGCTDIHFIKPGVKVNGHTIVTTFLPRSYCQTCTSWPRTNFLFQQDGAPAHQAHDTVTFLE